MATLQGRPDAHVAWERRQLSWPKTTCVVTDRAGIQPRTLWFKSGTLLLLLYPTAFVSLSFIMILMLYISGTNKWTFKRLDREMGS